MTRHLQPAFVVQQNETLLHVYHASVGYGLPRHVHSHSHLTICAAGSLIVRKERVEHTMTKDSQPVSLKGDEWHELEALEDGTVFINVFAASESAQAVHHA